MPALRQILDSTALVRIALGALTAAALLGAAAIRKADQVTNAVPRPEFLDTAKAIRQDVSTAAVRAEAAARQATSVSCYIAKYPAGLCDDFIPRPAQAGSAAPTSRTP